MNPDALSPRSEPVVVVAARSREAIEPRRQKGGRPSCRAAALPATVAKRACAPMGPSGSVFSFSFKPYSLNFKVSLQASTFIFSPQTASSLWYLGTCDDDADDDDNMDEDNDDEDNENEDANDDPDDIDDDRGISA